jgi:hypothetical protein
LVYWPDINLLVEAIRGGIVNTMMNARKWKQKKRLTMLANANPTNTVITMNFTAR